MVIREMKKEEYPLLERFLYEAIFQRDGDEKLPFAVIYQPELFVYVDGFGTKRGDLCLSAETDGQAVGAVWTRIIPAYGHVDDETPEFAISILPEYRGGGIGTKLMQAMLEKLRTEGFHQASLSVQKDNYALCMYRKLGFEPIRENEEEFIMVYRLADHAE